MSGMMRFDPQIFEALKNITKRLSIYDDWIVSGSSAMLLHGFNIAPNDLDIWCSQNLLFEIAKNFCIPVEYYHKTNYSHSGFVTLINNINVEFAGRVIVRDSLIMEVDIEMLISAKGIPKVQSIEDLIAELLTLNRPLPKLDSERAKKLACTVDSFDYDVFAYRLKSFGHKHLVVKHMLNNIRTWRQE
jgi:hypothetical protein